MKARNTSFQFEEQVAAMKAEVQQEQDRSADDLERQRRTFEAALKRQRELNELLQRNINATNDDTAALTKENDRHEYKLRNLQSDNNELRTTLQTYHDHIDTARLFVIDSLKVTDDKGAKELHILSRVEAPPTVDNFLKFAKSVKPAFLQIPLTFADVGEEEVTALARTVSAMSAATREAADNLKRDFKAAWEVVKETQQSLNATLAQSTTAKAQQLARKDALQEAETRLQATNMELNQRLDALREFTKSMGGAAETERSTQVRSAPAQKIVTAVSQRESAAASALRQLAAREAIIERVRAQEAAKASALPESAPLAVNNLVARARAQAAQAQESATAAPAAARPVSSLAAALRRPFETSSPTAPAMAASPTAPLNAGWFPNFR